jgi:hypothetical protein
MFYCAGRTRRERGGRVFIYVRRIIMSKLNGLRVAVLATDGFEEPELTEPVKALKDAGALAASKHT